MSDLISRSELLKAMDTWDKFGYDEHNRLIKIDRTNEEYVPYVHYEDMVKCVNDMPTAYSVDKVVEELEKIRAKETCNKEKCDTKEICRICVVDDAIEIVKHGDASDDVCEWNQNKGGVGLKTYKISCFGKTLEMPVSTARGLKYCPYCGKKIKVVE